MANPISLKLKKVFFEQKWGRSCFFGCPDIPTMYLRITEPDEMFFAQFNLEEISKVYNNVLLPSKGMLYFFIRLSDYKPIIRYYSKNHYDEEKMGRVDFNNNIETHLNYLKEYKVIYSHTYKRLSSLLLDEETKYDEMMPDEVILLQYDQRNNPKLLDINGILLFVIPREELLLRNYDAVRLIIIR